MIKLTKDQIDLLNEKNYSNIIISNSYTTYETINTYTQSDEIFEDICNICGITDSLENIKKSGYLSNLNKFADFLNTSEVYFAAILVGSNNPQVRKLVFELTFWIQSDVGKNAPSLVLSTWREINSVTKGEIKKSCSEEAIRDWNLIIDECQMLQDFKL